MIETECTFDNELIPNYIAILTMLVANEHFTAFNSLFCKIDDAAQALGNTEDADHWKQAVSLLYRLCCKTITKNAAIIKLLVTRRIFLPKETFSGRKNIICLVAECYKNNSAALQGVLDQLKACIPDDRDSKRVYLLSLRAQNITCDKPQTGKFTAEVFDEPYATFVQTGEVKESKKLLAQAIEHNDLSALLEALEALTPHAQCMQLADRLASLNSTQQPVDIVIESTEEKANTTEQSLAMIDRVAAQLLLMQTTLGQLCQQLARTSKMHRLSQVLDLWSVDQWITEILLTCYDSSVLIDALHYRNSTSSSTSTVKNVFSTLALSLEYYLNRTTTDYLTHLVTPYFNDASSAQQYLTKLGLLKTETQLPVPWLVDPNINQIIADYICAPAPGTWGKEKRDSHSKYAREFLAAYPDHDLQNQYKNHLNVQLKIQLLDQIIKKITAASNSATSSIDTSHWRRIIPLQLIAMIIFTPPIVTQTIKYDAIEARKFIDHHNNQTHVLNINRCENVFETDLVRNYYCDLSTAHQNEGYSEQAYEWCRHLCSHLAKISISQTTLIAFFSVIMFILCIVCLFFTSTRSNSPLCKAASDFFDAEDKEKLRKLGLFNNDEHGLEGKTLEEVQIAAVSCLSILNQSADNHTKIEIIEDEDNNADEKRLEN